MPGRDYNLLERFIHKMALQYTSVAEMSFDIENSLAKNKQDLPLNHVFISGLARSGTTALLNYLYSTGEFSSPTYADMPFVLMPNTWRKISFRRKSISHHERAHNDGIMINAESPEAFEEVFWRAFCGKDYIADDRLDLHNVGAGLDKKFKKYISNVLGEGHRRYLSKNNNNILRIGYLQNAFSHAHIIVPFRNPLQQAISLLDQHIRFSEIHKNDRFALNYMNWLGHFEFGLNQKPFFLGDKVLCNKMLSYPKTDINFWLLSWKNYYQYVSRYPGSNTILFNYEKFCADPARVLAALFLKIGIKEPAFEPAPFRPAIKSAEGVDEALLEECISIYDALASQSV